MTTEALKAWLDTRIVASLTTASSTPRVASDGMLNSVGFSASDAAIYHVWDETAILAETKIVVVLEETQSTRNRVERSGEFIKRHELAIQVVWVYAVYGDPVTSTAPTYTTKAEAHARFNKFVDALEDTLFYVNYQEEASGAVLPVITPVTDAATGEQSRISGDSFEVRVTRYDPKPREGGTKLIYGAIVEVAFNEII